MNKRQFGLLHVRRKPLRRPVSVQLRSGLLRSEAARLWSRRRDLGLSLILCPAAPGARWEFGPIRNPGTREGGVARIRSGVMSTVTTDPDTMQKAFHDDEVAIVGSRNQAMLRVAVVDQFAQQEGK